jgi:uncharacterized protein (TIGR03083 family)
VSNADTNIAALRTGHDRLVAFVEALSDDNLSRKSGAAKWPVARVLSHLGSGAEIGRALVQASLDGTPRPGTDFNAAVWDRWNVLSARQQADGFREANNALVERYESLDADTREHLRIDLGYLPAPVDVQTAARLRLSEFTLHAWDVQIGFDDHATLAPEAAGPLLQGSGDLLGWIAKPDQLNGTHGVIKVTTTEPASVFALRLGDTVSVDTDVPAQPDGTLTLPAEAWLRLVAGRLAPQRTPAGVSTTGAADLDLLRRVFPGY